MPAKCGTTDPNSEGTRSAAMRVLPKGTRLSPNAVPAESAGHPPLHCKPPNHARPFLITHAWASQHNTWANPAAPYSHSGSSPGRVVPGSCARGTGTGGTAGVAVLHTYWPGSCH